MEERVERVEGMKHIQQDHRGSGIPRDLLRREEEANAFFRWRPLKDGVEKRLVLHHW